MKLYIAEKEFCEYFKDTWLGSRHNWFESASIYTPSHNNHVEGTNQAIKRDVTMRERLPLAEFTEAVLEMTRKISINYAQNLRSFATEPKMPLTLWRNGASWAKSDTPQEIISDGPDEIIAQVISTKGTQSGLTFDQIKELQKKNGLISTSSQMVPFINSGQYIFQSGIGKYIHDANVLIFSRTICVNI